MSLLSHRSPNSFFERAMAGLHSVAFSAFSLPHQPVPAGTVAVPCGLAPLHVGLTVAFSGSFFLSCSLVTSQHHRRKNRPKNRGKISTAAKKIAKETCLLTSEP